MYNPRWPAVILFLAGLAVLLYAGRRIAARMQRSRPSFPAVKSLALLAVSLATAYIAAFKA